MSVSNKYLLDLLNQFESIKVSVKNVADGISEEQFNVRPAKNRWSVGECIEHLNASYTAYNPIIKNVITNNFNEHVINPENFKPRFRFKFFTAWLEPPYRMKVKTFNIFMPKEKLKKDETISNFISGTDEFIDFIKKSEKVDIKKTIIISPVSDKLKFQLGEFYPFMAAHIRRHIWQADQVKNVII